MNCSDCGSLLVLRTDGYVCPMGCMSWKSASPPPVITTGPSWLSPREAELVKVAREIFDGYVSYPRLAAALAAYKDEPKTKGGI